MNGIAGARLGAIVEKVAGHVEDRPGSLFGAGTDSAFMPATFATGSERDRMRAAASS